MKFHFLTLVGKWASRILSYPGIDKQVLAQKKINWYTSVALTVLIASLTIVYHLIFPQIRILIYYGLVLTFIFLQGAIFPLFIRQKGVWWRFVSQCLVAVATFITILELGGIPYSGGLILIGLALVFFSLNFKEKKATLAIFIVYIITVILAGVLHPYLEVPQEMTPAVNNSLFVINLLWISGFATIFVINFISQRVEFEHKEAQHFKELEKAKTRLCANISHECRTPLTIIKGMIDLMRNDPEKWLEEGGERIYYNSNIILRLINQMLDLTKIEAGVMPVRLIRADINQYIKYIVESFEQVAAEKQITLEYNHSGQETVIDYDPEKIMEIISNLISNALKFTQIGGHVEIRSALKENNRFEILINDNGPGISEDHLPFIFDRFYRIAGDSVRLMPGSGLGLSVTKEMVTLLGGTITVESVYGEGTAFTIVLPVTRKAEIEEIDDLEQVKKSMISSYILLEEKKAPLPVDEPSVGDKPLLLIVEDNADMIGYLLTIVEEDFDVMIAFNGQEGFCKATEFIPDIILSDIMMPVMDGIELLTHVKDDIRTSHIPMVMLTAKADIESRLKGLEQGADAYIAKPFNRQELLVQMRALIDQRKRLQERYATINDLKLQEEKEYEKEDTFMRQVRKIMIYRLGDDKFDINSLCHELSLSRTQLYRKFNTLTNKTISEYLRTLRLYRAKELLDMSELSVTEVAYKTGFKNVSHFSRVFKAEFNVNPRDISKR